MYGVSGIIPRVMPNMFVSGIVAYRYEGKGMSDLRGRHGRNFQGTHLQVTGTDEDLNTYLDEMDTVPQCLVYGRADTTTGNGVVFMQVKTSIVPHIQEIAFKHHLAVIL